MQTGDLLKHKIQQRPDKQKLLAQHILLGKIHFKCHCKVESQVHLFLDEPSIQEKHQQHLKKCRISESLNEKLAFRPGSLELVPRNILNVEETLDQVVKGTFPQVEVLIAG